MERLKKYREWVNRRFGKYPGGSEADWLVAIEGLSDKQMKEICQIILRRKVKPEFHMDVFLSKKNNPLSDPEYLLTEKRTPDIGMQAAMRRFRPHLFGKTQEQDSETWDSSKKQTNLGPPSEAA